MSSRRSVSAGSRESADVTSEELREALAVAVGDGSRVSDGESERDLHASDISFHRPVRPDVVVYATSTGDVSAVLALADGLGIPVTPFGAGSSLEGHVIPVHGGISLDLSRMNRVLDLSPQLIGLSIVPVGVGGLAAAFVARRIAARLGVGPTLIGSALVFGPATIAFPLAPVDFPLPFLVAGFALLGFGGILFNITGISLVQTLTPDRLLGRLNATRRFLVWGAIPLGSLAGGALASTIGLRPTLFVGAAGSCACFLPMLLSPLRTLREMPEEQETDPFQMPIAGATAAAAARLDA